MSISAELPSFLYGTAWKEERTEALVTLALGAGFRGIDTANQRRHYFEAGIGDALKQAFDAGIVSRSDLFLQTKYTYQAGQDHRLPYDPNASLSIQVEQSLASSLDHLHTDHVDSFVLHGPASGQGWMSSDSEVWAAMRRERDAGRARLLGVSNVWLRHLEQMAAHESELPKFVQNRCYARFGWDREVREFCRGHDITYQGFSLLTANLAVLEHPATLRPAQRLGVTPPQVVFRFAMAVGMLPLTGTSSPAHMQQDLASSKLELLPDEVAAIESIASWFRS